MPWRQVPLAVRGAVEKALGAPVTRAVRVWGGYGPTPTFRLALANGQRAFFKATNAESNEFATHALDAERQVYAEVGDLIGAWMPDFYAVIAVDDWHGLLLEDLGPKSVPPWTPARTRRIAHGLAAFHQATIDVMLPDWLSRPDARLAAERWDDVVAQTDDLRRVAALADDDATHARRWLQQVSPRIAAHMASLVLARGPMALLHGDLRSDNLRLRHGRLYLFDWPAITVGRAEWDMVAFSQTVTVEGGALPEQVLAWYAEKSALDAAAVDVALAWWFAFFAMRAWREEVPGLPRLRRFQRQQLGILAQWMARAWALPAPTWTEALLR